MKFIKLHSTLECKANMKKLSYKIVLFAIVYFTALICMSLTLNLLGEFIFEKEILKNTHWIFMVNFASILYGFLISEFFVGLIRFMLNDFRKQ